MYCTRYLFFAESVLFILFSVFFVVTMEKMRKKIIRALLCHTSSWSDSGCSAPQELWEESGTFTSENYPSNYDNGKGCTWHISVGPDKVIYISITAFPNFIQYIL